MMNEPEFQDLVKHRVTHVTGTVIAKYEKLAIKKITGGMKDYLKGFVLCKFIDVRLETGGGDRNIWYGSPVENWEVIKPYDPENE